MIVSEKHRRTLPVLLRGEILSDRSWSPFCDAGDLDLLRSDLSLDTLFLLLYDKRSTSEYEQAVLRSSVIETERGHVG